MAEGTSVTRVGAADGPGACPRYGLLDVWRGVACLMVVLHHAGFAVAFSATNEGGVDSWMQRRVVEFLMAMNLGVPLFFVISGYCIAASVDSARRRGAGAWRFLGRRAWRIYPPYWAALLGFVAVAAVLDATGFARQRPGEAPHALELAPPGTLAPAQWVGNITLTEEYRTFFWRPPEKLVLTRVAWSLCYEEQFYLVCFLALLATRRLSLALTATTAAAIGLRLATEDVGQAGRLDGSFLNLWQEFAVGLAVYWRLNRAISRRSRRLADTFLATLLVLWAMGYFRQTPVSGSTAVAAAFGMVLIALRPYDGRAARLGPLAHLRACGRRGYSIYLAHLPVCTVGNIGLFRLGVTGFWPNALVTVPLVSTAAVGIGWLFYHGVERHFLNPSTAPPHAPPAVA